VHTLIFDIDDLNSFLGKDLKAYVDFYKKLGFAVIPLLPKSKSPFLKTWKEYESRKPADEEIGKWFNEDNLAKHINIGVICGSVSGNLVVIDFDDPEIYRKFFDPEIEKHTLVVKTARGIQVYLISKDRCPSFRIPQLKMEVRSDGNYVVAPPSIHPTGHQYFFQNPEVKNILEVEGLEESVWKRVEKLGVKQPESILDEPDALVCIKKLLKGIESGQRNEAAIRLAAYWLYFKHEEKNVAFSLLKAWNRKNNPPLPDSEIKNVIKSALRGGYEYGCSSMKELNVCTPEIEKTCKIANSLQIKKLEIIKTPFVELNDGRLAEQGYDGEKVYYIVYDPKDGSIKKEEFLTEGEAKYQPILDDDVKTRQVLFPQWAVEYGSDKDLWKEAEEFLDYWHEQTVRKDRKLDVGYVFTSWITFGKNCLGMLPTIGGRRFLGRLGRGKTAGMHAVGVICYRPFYLAGAASEAAIRRLFHFWRGTALMDEADFSRSDLYATIVKVLNIGIDAQLGWYRCCDENDPSKVLSFYVYGPKIATTRSRFKDAALESRFLTTIARENRTPKPLYRWKKFQQQAQALRNKFLMWRFRHYNQIKEKIARLEDPEFAKEVFGEDLKVSSRIKEIVLPIALLVDKETVEVLKEVAIQHDKTMKQIDLEAEFENEIIQVIEDLGKQAKEARETKPDKLDRLDRLDRSLLEQGVLRISLSDVAARIAPKASAEEINDLLKRIGRFFRDNEVQVERVRIGEGQRIRIALIPPGHHLRASISNGPIGLIGPSGKGGS